MINPDTAPFLMNAGNLERTRVAPGMLMTFLAIARDTGGVFALIDARGRQGMEPQPHIHSNEDESIYLLSGRVWFKIGQDEYGVFKMNVRHEVA